LDHLKHVEAPELAVRRLLAKDGGEPRGFALGVDLGHHSKDGAALCAWEWTGCMGHEQHLPWHDTSTNTSTCGKDTDRWEKRREGIVYRVPVRNKRHRGLATNNLDSFHAKKKKIKTK